ncbi:MAG: hypothetical protein RR101_00445 [Burkholderiaceae bacterium]
MSELCLPTPASSDQAAGLRRLFAPRGARLLPVIVPDAKSTRRGLALAQLARAFAAAGDRTLVLDAARQNLAHELGQRARFDLFHGLAGERALSEVLLPAAPRLRVAPAARAIEQAAAHRLSLMSAIAHAAPGADIVLLALEAARVDDLKGEAILLVGPTTTAVAAAAAELATLSMRSDGLAFRLVFADLEEAAARTLHERLLSSLPRPPKAELRWGGNLAGPADAARLAVAASGWDLAHIAGKS